MDNKLYSAFYLKKQDKQLYCSNPLVAYIQYKNFRIDLITGSRVKKGISDFFEELETYKISEETELPIVVHLMYELGFYCVDLEDKIDDHLPLAIFIKYEESSIEEIDRSIDTNINLLPLKVPEFEDYENMFNQTYHHLLEGDCYQLNLTMPFYFKTEEDIDPQEFIKSLWLDKKLIAPYSHATYIDSLGKLFLSNSPECLFQVDKKELKVSTMPIKGTVEVDKFKSREEAWNSLLQSKKDQGELNMITDLMRNDLTKINLNPATVIEKSAPLHVPKLVHQYSVIETMVSPNTSLSKVIMCLFPGGSITGAPKKNVMKLISEIEKEPRGLYCGSTILLHKDKISASINIRSSEIDYIQKEIKYGSGGGITLKSNVRDEFDEILGKLKSFLLLLK